MKELEAEVARLQALHVDGARKPGGASGTSGAHGERGAAAAAAASAPAPVLERQNTQAWAFSPPQQATGASAAAAALAAVSRGHAHGNGSGAPAARPSLLSRLASFSPAPAWKRPIKVPRRRAGQGGARAGLPAGSTGHWRAAVRKGRPLPSESAAPLASPSQVGSP